jgi:hypothetical protein
MANANSTQQDHSRFQLRSYGWRNIDIGTDHAIRLLEKAFQSANGIEGIVATLRQGLGDGDLEEPTLNAYQTNQLLGAIEQLASSLACDICVYAGDLENKIEAHAANMKKGAKND